MLTPEPSVLGEAHHPILTVFPDFSSHGLLRQLITTFFDRIYIIGGDIIEIFLNKEDNNKRIKVLLGFPAISKHIPQGRGRAYYDGLRR